MWTVPLVLVRRTLCHTLSPPAHADFGGLSSLATLVVVRLDVVPLPPSSLRRRWRVVGWGDILLDVISGVEKAAGGMSGDVLWAFLTGVFNTIALPRINIGDDVWGESSITDRCLLMLVLVYFAHQMGSV